MSVQSKALAILDKYWDRVIPINVKSIAEAAGLNVIEKDIIDGDQSISGKFSLEENRPTITLKSNEFKPRQRFTLAHELGHYFMGHGASIDDNKSIYRNKPDSYDWREREANAFAAEVLMPKMVINFLIEDKDITTVEELAKLLNVSESAMRYRLKNVGWLGHE